MENWRDRISPTFQSNSTSQSFALCLWFPSKTGLDLGFWSFFQIWVRISRWGVFCLRLACIWCRSFSGCRSRSDFLSYSMVFLEGACWSTTISCLALSRARWSSDLIRRSNLPSLFWGPICWWTVPVSACRFWFPAFLRVVSSSCRSFSSISWRSSLPLRTRSCDGLPVATVCDSDAGTGFRCGRAWVLRWWPIFWDIQHRVRWVVGLLRGSRFLPCVSWSGGASAWSPCSP